MPTTFFLAHASADKPRVRQLYDALVKRGISVFYDEASLFPGDNWTLEIPRAQRGSLATLIAVSPRYEAAHYLQDEIQSSIALARHPEHAHRAIPIFLDGFPANPMEMPYGIRVLTGLDWRALGLDGLVERLAEVAARLTGEAPPPAAAMAATGDKLGREALYDAICRMSPLQLDRLLAFDLPEAEIEIAPKIAPHAARALDLVMWAARAGRLDALEAAARRRAPGCFDAP